jgi:hypothetical protein
VLYDYVSQYKNQTDQGDETESLEMEGSEMEERLAREDVKTETIFIV